MSGILRQSTAVTLSFGPFVAPGDGVTPQTGLVSAIDHATTGIMCSKNGGALAVRHATVTPSTYDGYGNYLVTLDTTDTATVGRLRVQFAAAASCLPVWRDFDVISQSVYDALFANAAAGYSTYAGGAVGSVTGAVGSVTADVGITQAGADKVWGSAARSLTTFGTLVADIATAVWGAATRLLTAGTNIALAKGVGLTGLNDIAATAIVSAGAITTSAGKVSGVATVDAVTGLTASDVGAIKAITDALPTFVHTGGKVWALDSDGNAISTAAAISDAVWDEATSDHQTAGSTGKALTSAYALGVGAITWTYTLTRSDNAAPIADADVWVTSDLAGTNVLASGRTNASGVVTLQLDAGTVYVWRQKTGFNFSNPDSEVVS